MALNMFHQRKHIRLRHFDYSSANAYFITVCVKHFEPLLGQVRNSICGLSEIGNDVALRLQNIPALNKYVLLDEFIVMPNHFHVLLIIREHHGTWLENRFQKPVSGSISMIINAAKGATIKWCKANHHTKFKWQDRFHDHVVRNEQEYWAIKNYIINNPRNWEKDKFYK